MHIWKKKIYFHLIFILSKRIKKFYNSNIFLSYCIFNLYKIFNSFTLLLLLLWTKQILENNYFGKWEKLTWGWLHACMKTFSQSPLTDLAVPLVPDHPLLADHRPSSPAPAVCPRRLPSALCPHSYTFYGGLPSTRS